MYLLIISKSDCSGGGRSERWSYRLSYCACTAIKAYFALRSPLVLYAFCLLHLPLVSYLTVDCRIGMNEK